MDINENKKIVCITGANGQLGKAINNKLFPHYKIYNLDALTYAGNLANLTDIESKNNYTFIKGDI